MTLDARIKQIQRKPRLNIIAIKIGDAIIPVGGDKKKSPRRNYA